MGPQIEARLASVNEELTACTLEHAEMSQHTEELLVAYNNAVDKLREVENRGQQLEDTEKLLWDLHAIALTYFPPTPGQM